MPWILLTCQSISKRPGLSAPAYHDHFLSLLWRKWERWALLEVESIGLILPRHCKYATSHHHFPSTTSGHRGWRPMRKQVSDGHRTPLYNPPLLNPTAVLYHQKMTYETLLFKYSGKHVERITYVAMRGCGASVRSGHHAIVLTECLWPSSTTTDSDATSPGIESAGLDISTFHTRPVVSSEHDANRVPAALHSIWLISFWCPLSIHLIEMTNVKMFIIRTLVSLSAHPGQLAEQISCCQHHRLRR